MTQILGQYCINVRDIDKALEFWEGVCELPLQHRTEIPGVLEAVLQAEQGGSRIQLAQHLENDAPLTWDCDVENICQHIGLSKGVRSRYRCWM